MLCSMKWVSFNMPQLSQLLTFMVKSFSNGLNSFFSFFLWLCSFILKDLMKSETWKLFDSIFPSYGHQRHKEPEIETHGGFYFVAWAQLFQPWHYKALLVVVSRLAWYDTLSKRQKLQIYQSHCNKEAQFLICICHIVYGVVSRWYCFILLEM